MRLLHELGAALAISSLILSPASAGKRPAKDVAEADGAGPSKAITNSTVDAVASEMGRALSALTIPGEESPYFLGYKLTEVEVNDVAATLGQTTARKDRHFVNLDTHAHVGDYTFDNSNFVIPQGEFIDGIATIQLPLEATPRLASRATWLATDAAYKEALLQLRTKQEAQRTGGARPGVASYTKEEPFVSDEQVLVAKLEELSTLEDRAQKISAVFRGVDHVRDSRVAFTSFLERRWYLNSEGTSATDTRRVSGVVITASGQAEDGQELALHFTRYGITAADLPSDAELIDEAKKLASTLAALRTAPVMENYSGPVLFDDQGAADMVRYTLAGNLGGTPVPAGMTPQEAKMFGGALAGKKNLRVLAPELTLIDDPTARSAGNRALIGAYKLDDEGVPAKRVQVVANGKLVSLLTSRTPSQDFAGSNGHARRTGPGGVFHGSATNLFVEARRGLSDAQLKQRLLAEVKRQGLEYGLIIRGFDDAAITAAPELSKPQLIRLFRTTDVLAPPPVSLAYRVYPTGKEELVRGVQLKEVDIRAWKDIVAAGRDKFVANFLASPEMWVEHKISGGTPEGFVPSGGVESAVITPNLLFKELDVTGSAAGRRAAPAIPPPAPK